MVLKVFASFGKNFLNEGKGEAMRKSGLILLLAAILVSGLMATYYDDRAVSAMEYVTDPVNGLFHPTEGLTWIDTDPINPAVPATDNQTPAYLGAYFFTNAAIWMGMNATGVGVPFVYNGIERVFITNNVKDTTAGLHISTAGGIEPWFSEASDICGWDIFQMLMADAQIPWRFDPSMSFAIDSSEVYLERVLWSTYFLALCDNYEYSPYIVKILRGIRDNDLYYNSTNGAIKYNGVDNLYLTALWGLVLESHMRAFDSYPVSRPGFSVPDPPPTDYEWDEESEAAWLYIQAMLRYYGDYILPAWWSNYSCPETRSPMAAIDGLRRWESLPVMMFAAARDEQALAESLWNADMDDVGHIAWRNDVRDYFRDGPIWNGSRGYYEPLSRRAGINCFYELGQMEMYRAFSDTDYIDKILDVDTDYWDALRWDGVWWDWNYHCAPMVNGIHAWISMHIPELEIVDVISDLPSEGTIPYDYNANTTQDYRITIKIANHSLSAVDSVRLAILEAYIGPGGGRLGYVYAIHIEPGETLDVVYDIGGPGIACDHDIEVWPADAPWDTLTGITDNDLLVNCTAPPLLEMTFTGGSAASAPYNPFITEGSVFDLEIEITNNGGGIIREVDLSLAQSSPYGLAFTFPGGTTFDGTVNVEAGLSEGVMFGAEAPMGTGIVGDDIYVEATLIEAIDENTRLPIPPADITITDSTEWFDIQHPPSITPVSVVTSGWLNATDPCTVTVNFQNAAGDYATADSWGIYDHLIQLESSIITGVLGLDLGVDGTAFVTEGSAGFIEFVLQNDGASENVWADVHAIFPYHDGNRGDEAEPVDSPFDHVFPNALGIDILAPWVDPIEPSMGDIWPVDNIVKIEGYDNLSGVDYIWIYFMDGYGGNYWSTGGGWGATADTFALSYYSGDEWRRTMAVPPTGTDFIMYVLAGDIAGNVMPVEYVAIGDVYYVNIIESGADLWRGGPLAPVDPLDPWDYECDANWTYQCSVYVFNHNAFTVNDVQVRLRSSSPHTVTDTFGLGEIDILPFSGEWFWFEVTEPGYTFLDSLWFDIVAGTDASGDPIGEQYSDKDMLVMVERHADFEIVNVWVEPDSINMWFGGDTALVSHYQTYSFYGAFRNNGDDYIDSVEVWPTQTGPSNHHLFSSYGPFTYFNKGNGWIDTLHIGAIADTNDPGPNPEQWDTDIVYEWEMTAFTAHNHEPGYTTNLWTITDDFAPLGVQENAWLDEYLYWSDGDPDFVWINMTNTVRVSVGIYNKEGTATGTPKDDRAAADRITDADHDAVLTIYNSGGFATIPVFDGTDAPVEVLSTLIEPGESTLVSWDISWNSALPAYEGDVRIYYVLDYGDQNWQSQMDSRWSPSTGMSAVGVIGLDVHQPWLDIVFPIESGKYNEFPETLKVIAFDNVSGVEPDSMKVQFENPNGDIWDGTVWGSDDVWFEAHYDLTLGPDTFWYDIPEQTIEGCYTYRAYVYDEAGNKSDIEEVNFVYDTTPPNSYIVLPVPGYYSYTACTPWDQVIEVWAYDDTTNAPPACVSHVKKAYVAIRDTIRDQWWNGTAWQTSSSVPWLMCSVTADPLIWEYTGFTDMTSAVLEFYCYARDTANNLSSDHDTVQFVRIDENIPNSVVTDKDLNELPAISYFGFDTWNTTMNGYLWGFAYDPWSRIDTIFYAVYEDMTGMHWDGASWVSSGSDIWLHPDEYSYNGVSWFTGPPNPSELFTFGEDTLYWRAAFSPFGYGSYRVRTMSYDDLCHEETPLYDSQNQKWFYYDNCLPVIHPRFPEAGRAYYIGEWHDSIAVHAYDSCGFPMQDVDSVRYWLTNSSGEYFGYHPVWAYEGWWPLPIYFEPTLQPGGEGIWMYRHPGMITTPGSYNLFVRAYDSAGNIALNAWNFTITVSGQYLTIENYLSVPNDDPYFVDDPFYCRVIAWHHPGVVDTNFAHELVFGNTMPLPADFEILTPGPYYTYRGTTDVMCVAHEPILGLEVFVDSPTSGLPRATTEPIDILQNIDDAIDGFVIDNPDDQGNWLWLHHNRTPQDPDWGDPGTIDTLSIKILEYRYARDMNTSPDPGDTNWQPIVFVDDASDGDSVRLEFGNFNTFVTYDYSLIVKIHVQGLGDSMFTGRIMFGSGTPVDNIAPASIVDLAATAVGGGAIQLDWTEIALGWDASPEIDPATNIVYDIYKFTEPYGAIGTPLVTGWTTPTYTDATGAGDVTTPYYYVVKGRDHDGNETPDESNRVGEVDYDLADGWSSFGYPLPVTGLTAPGDFATRLGAPYNNIYTYVNPPGGWYGLRVAGFDFDVLNPGLEAMLGSITGFGAAVMTWTGDIPPDSTAIQYALNYEAVASNGWNLIMLPLHHGHLPMASDLYYELDGLGVDPLTVAYRVAGGGWVSIVDLGGVIYFDFPIYPGQVYLVWVNSDGTWPAYARSGGADPVDATFEPTDAGIDMPKSLVIPVYTDDGEELEEVRATAVWGEQSVDCSYQNGVVRVEFSNFDGIVPGTLVDVIIESGEYVAQTSVAVPSGPVEYAKPLYLEQSGSALPDEFALHSNVPNPFNPATSIKIDLPEGTHCDLTIYNLNGRAVRKLVSEDLEAGYHTVIWNGTDNSGRAVPGGIYFYKLTAGDFSSQRRMMLVK